MEFEGLELDKPDEVRLLEDKGVLEHETVQEDDVRRARNILINLIEINLEKFPNIISEFNLEIDKHKNLLQTKKPNYPK